MKKYMMILFVIFLTSCEKDSVSNVLQVDEETELRVKKPKINVCHYDASVGSWKIISINENAWAAFSRNGAVKLIDNDKDGFVNSANECGIPVDCDDTNSALTNNCSEGTITYEGQIYATKLMPDGKWWMVENLNIGTMINDRTNMTNNGTIEKYCYGNNPANCDTYGGLYQWDEIMQYTITESAQGICPTGWHIPTHEEWAALEAALPNTDKGSRLAGNATLWADGVLDQSIYFGTSGFAALPAGFRNVYGSFSDPSFGAFFWSSTEESISASTRIINRNYTDVIRSSPNKSYGFSVRCVKD